MYNHQHLPYHLFTLKFPCKPPKNLAFFHISISICHPHYCILKIFKYIPYPVNKSTFKILFAQTGALLLLKIYITVVGTHTSDGILINHSIAGHRRRAY
jgi:hypothetical protein